MPCSHYDKWVLDLRQNQERAPHKRQERLPAGRWVAEGIPLDFQVVARVAGWGAGEEARVEVATAEEWMSW